MRRRITVAMASLVAGALVVAAIVLSLVTVHDTRATTRRELVREAQGLALAVRVGAVDRRDPARALRILLVDLRRPLRLDGAAVVAVGPGGQLSNPVSPGHAPVLPAHLTASDLRGTDLAVGDAVSGTSGPVVFAAVPQRTAARVGGGGTPVRLAVVLTRSPPTGLGSAWPLLAVTAVIILALAALVARRLARRFTRPLDDAVAVTGRIAAGDLSARVTRPEGAGPELVELAGSINAMAAALDRSRGSERQFLLSVSHDLRTPLTSIRGFAEAIEDGVTPDTVAAAGVIAAEGRRLERLVGDLLDLATVEARAFVLDLRPVDVTALVGAGSRAFAPMARDLGLVLDIMPGADAPVVLADEDRLAQVVANVVENALKYAATRVTVAVAAEGPTAEIRVTDDGPGIARTDLPRVFERLYSSRSRPGRTVGSGLGLAIVAELVGAMGGTVRAESPVGPEGGTTVVITLPQP